MPGRGTPIVRAVTIALALLTTAAPLARPLRAQAVLGPFEDAMPAPRGAIRFGTGLGFTHFDRRFEPDGKARGVFSRFDADTVGVAQLPQLAAAQTAIGTLTGDPTFRLSLGSLAVLSRARSTSIPITLEAGITRRLTLGVMAPYVRTLHTVVGRIGPDAGQANVGFNPALTDGETVRNTNAQVFNQLQTARTQLAALIAACRAAPSGAGCAPINASPATADALVTQSAAFAAALAATYGVAEGPMSPFVPSVGSSANAAVMARLASFDSLYQALLGSSTALITARPEAAVPVALGGVQRALTDSALGIVASPLGRERRSHFGDVELDAKFLLLDSFGGPATARLTPGHGALNYRLALGATVRLGTGQADDPDNTTDLATGDGQTDVGMRAIADVLVGRRWWTSVVARYERQLADEPTLRVAGEAARLWAPLYTRQTVQRDLGDLWQVEATPRVALTQNFSLAAHYAYRHRARDAYEGSFTLDSATTGIGTVTLDADALLGAETAFTSHHVGLGASFSTLGDYLRGRTRFPLDVSYVHRRTVAAHGAWVPKDAVDEVSIKLYIRLFGARPSRPAVPYGPPTTAPATPPAAAPTPARPPA